MAEAYTFEIGRMMFGLYKSFRNVSGFGIQHLAGNDILYNLGPCYIWIKSNTHK